MIHFFKCLTLEHNFEFSKMELVLCVLTIEKSAKPTSKISYIFVSTHLPDTTEKKVAECFGAKSAGVNWMTIGRCTSSSPPVPTGGLYSHFGKSLKNLELPM